MQNILWHHSMQVFTRTLQMLHNSPAALLRSLKQPQGNTLICQMQAAYLMKLNLLHLKLDQCRCKLLKSAICLHITL